MTKLGKLDDLVEKQEGKICVLNRLLQGTESKKISDGEISNLLKKLFPNLQNILNNKFNVGICWKNDYRYFFKYLIKEQKLEKQVLTEYLCSASYYNCFDIIKYLLETDINKNFNVDLKISDDEGINALIIAASKGHKEIVQYLIKAGANVNLSDHNGETALMDAASQGHKEIVQDLIKAGANVNLSNNNGTTALRAAVLKGHKEIVQDLIKAGSKVDLLGKNGVTALMVAVSQCHKEIVQDLIKAGADVDIKKNQGQTPLMLAALQGHKEILEYLIEAGANVNISDDSGITITALMIAASQGHEDIVELLLNAATNNGKTPRTSIKPEEWQPKKDNQNRWR